MMLQYVRDSKRRKVGVLVAALNAQGDMVVGHSKWNKVLDKKYDLERGMQVATDRLNKESSTSPALSIRRPYLKFLKRASKYFKDTNVCGGTITAVNRMVDKVAISKKANIEAAAAKAVEASAVAKYKSGKLPSKSSA